MAVMVLMPRSGQSVTSCILTRARKRVGETVIKGDVLFEYETDKAAFEEAAGADGVLLKWYCQEGDDVPCLQPVCAVGAAGEAAPEAEGQGTGNREQGTDVGAGQGIRNREQGTVGCEAAIAPEERRGVSPRARAAAQRMGVEADALAGTGPGGRVIERDVLAAYASAPSRMRGDAAPSADVEAVTQDARGGRAAPAGGYTDTPLPGIRKAIARSMTQSLATMAQLTNHASCDASALLNYRALLKSGGEAYGMAGVTVTDLVLYAVVKTLKRHPYLNAHLNGDTLRTFGAVHLGLAVDTPRGLMVPTIFNADTLSLKALSDEGKRLAAACREGAISPDALRGGTFTVSNLGALGVEVFTPVINPPQTGILGLCNIVERPRSAPGGGIELYPALGLSLTYDHRAVDGAPAARFLQDLGHALEHITLVLGAGGGNR